MILIHIHLYVLVLSLAGLELIFFIAAFGVLWFRFVTKTMQNTGVPTIAEQCLHSVNTACSWPCLPVHGLGVHGRWGGDTTRQVAQTNPRAISWRYITAIEREKVGVWGSWPSCAQELAGHRSACGVVLSQLLLHHLFCSFSFFLLLCLLNSLMLTYKFCCLSFFPLHGWG